MTADRQERIRHRAYAIWEREGRPEGREAEHWRMASHEIEEEERAASAAPGDAARTAAKPATEKAAAGKPAEAARPRRPATRRAPRAGEKG